MSLIALEKEEGANSGLIVAWLKHYVEEGEKGLDPKKKGNPFAALHTSKSLTEEEQLRLIIAKQEIEIERFKKGIMWKELV